MLQNGRMVCIVRVFYSLLGMYTYTPTMENVNEHCPDDDSTMRSRMQTIFLIKGCAILEWAGYI